MTVTINNIGELAIANGGPSAGGDTVAEYHLVDCSTTDTVASVPTKLSHIYGMSWTIADDDATTAVSNEMWQIDQNVDGITSADKNCIVVASGVVPLLRTLLGATALVARTYIVKFEGK